MPPDPIELVRDAAKVMPPIDEQVERLKIFKCKYRTLAPLASLRRLHTLDIDGFPDASLEILSELRELRYLRIMHLPKVTDLAPLRSLKHLETLSLETLPGWDPSGKKTIVTSLDPIGDLARLRHVSFFGVVPEDGSLAPLERCTQLQTACFSKYARSEMEQFFARTKVLKDHIPDWDDVND